MKELKNLLGEHLTPTNFDLEPEDYILTKEEEAAAISHEVRRKREHFVFKQIGRQIPKLLAEEKAAEIDWLKQVDTKRVLQIANSNKHYDIWQKEQREKDKKEAEEKATNLKNTWTAKMMLRFMRWTSENTYDKKLIENDQTLPLIKIVCFFLSEDERFETELGYSLKKGLLIRGACGLGKTYTIRCVSMNELNPVTIYSMIEIASAVKEDGDFELPKSKKIYLDDVGSEQSLVNHYGTKINWLKEFLETFYLRSNQYNRLILSTNLNASQLEAAYGFRVRSRLKDMFNVIDVEGIDMRGL
jgi:hypothetical protein